MSFKSIPSIVLLTTVSLVMFLISCSNPPNTSSNTADETADTVFPSEVFSLFDDFNLILGDGSNAGPPKDFQSKDFFFTQNDGQRDWVSIKPPMQEILMVHPIIPEQNWLN